MTGKGYPRTVAAPPEALYAGTCKQLELKLRAAFQGSIGADPTADSSSPTHGITLCKNTGKYMATFFVGKSFGSITKIFLHEEDAQFWFDSVNALYNKGGGCLFLASHMDGTALICLNPSRGDH